MKWISVKERLPDQFDHVLVSNSTLVGTAYFQDRVFVAIEPKIEDITHWMPLPEAPK